MGDRTLQISCGAPVLCCAPFHTSSCTKKYGRRTSEVSWISGVVFVLLTACMAAQSTVALPVNDVFSRGCQSESCLKLLQLITQTLPSPHKADLLAARVSDIYSRSFSSHVDNTDDESFNNIKTELDYRLNGEDNNDKAPDTGLDENRDNMEWLDRLLAHVTDTKWDNDPLSLDEREVEYRPDLPTMTWGQPVEDVPEVALGAGDLLRKGVEKRQQGWYIEYGKRTGDSADTRLHNNVRGDGGAGSNLDLAIQQQQTTEAPESFLHHLAPTWKGQFGSKALVLEDLMSTTRSQRLGLLGKLMQLLKSMPQIKTAPAPPPLPPLYDDNMFRSTDVQTKHLASRDAGLNLMRSRTDQAAPVAFGSNKSDDRSFSSDSSRGHVFKFNRETRGGINNIYGQNVEVSPVTKKRQQGWYIQYGKRNENDGRLEF